MIPADLLLITLFNLSFIVILPVYQLLRTRMTKNAVNENPSKNLFTRKRITKIVLSNFLLFASAITYFMVIFFSIVSRDSISSFTQIELLLTFVLFFISYIVSYGTGMYIISIIKEQFTTKSLRLHPEYKILFITNEYFHGPVSHVLIFSGGFFLFVVIAISELVNPIEKIGNAAFFSYILNGVIIGLLLAKAQIINLTWKHQLPWMLGIFIFYLLIVNQIDGDFKNIPFNLFFLVFGFTLNTILASKHIKHQLRGGFYKYDLFKQFYSKPRP